MLGFLLFFFYNGTASSFSEMWHLQTIFHQIIFFRKNAKQWNLCRHTPPWHKVNRTWCAIQVCTCRAGKSNIFRFASLFYFWSTRIPGMRKWEKFFPLRVYLNLDGPPFPKKAEEITTVFWQMSEKRRSASILIFYHLNNFSGILFLSGECGRFSTNRCCDYRSKTWLTWCYVMGYSEIWKWRKSEPSWRRLSYTRRSQYSHDFIIYCWCHRYDTKVRSSCGAYYE